MRPTGRLHIGNYFGALANWIKLQEDPANECFYFIADWHSLTSDYADTSQIAQNSIEIATDFLAAGLDPKKVTIFQQSQIMEHAELHLLLSMITPLGWLERVPTYKEQLENMKGKDLHTYGFLGYPVLQTADIVMYGEPDRGLVVPVGEDQVAHVELSREIVRRFNYSFGFAIDNDLNLEVNREARKNINLIVHTGVFVDSPVMADYAWNSWVGELRKIAQTIGVENALEELPIDLRHYYKFETKICEPEVLLTHTPRIPGTDGRKMSKSYGNAITLSESDEAIREKTRAMITDPARKRRTDPGNPDICPVYDWHKLFSPAETLSWSNVGCRTAKIGCIECKKAMADNLIKWISPLRERRLELEAHPTRVMQIVDEGSEHARNVAQVTMNRVREAVFGWTSKRAEIVADRMTSLKNSGAGN
jgi:tryptophanyl-tRNA synthetase